MLKAKEKFKTTPLLKGVTYGIVSVGLFYIHFILGAFALIGFMCLYEYLENSHKEVKTGKDYFYLTVFVLGAVAFIDYVIINSAI